MTSTAAIGGRLAWWSGVVATALAVGPSPHGAPLPLGLGNAPAGALVGALLFALLARRGIAPLEIARDRIGTVLAKTGYLTARAAYEEVIWRGLAFALVSAAAGPLSGFVLSTAGFALSHVATQRWRACAHLLTGATFAAVFYATGSLASAIAAHATYNVLIALGNEGRRIKPCPDRPIVGLASTTYDRGTLPTTGEGRPLSSPAERARHADGSVSPIELRGVFKRYGRTEALRGLDLELRSGEVLALLGPNGAGKTTAVSIALGLRKPSAGRALLFGGDPRAPESRTAVGATTQQIGFPWTLRVTDVVELVRAHFRDPVPSRELLERFQLSGVARKQTGALSGGERRRLAVALAFAGRPRALVLDEPSAGLDVESRRSLWDSIRAHERDGGCVLLTTHHLDEAEELATRIAVIAHGRVLAEGSVAEVKRRVGLTRVRVRVGILPELPAVARVVHEGPLTTLYTSDADATVAALVRADVPFSELEIAPVSLEEAFLELTREAR